MNARPWRHYFGVDPGTHVVGFAHLMHNGRDFKAVALGTIPYKGSVRSIMYAALYRDINRLAGPASVTNGVGNGCRYAVESGYVGINPKSAMRLSESRGVIIAAIGSGGDPIMEVTPQDVKKFTTGKGDATKDDVRYAVKCILGLKIAPLEDAADAAGVAVACAMLT